MSDARYSAGEVYRIAQEMEANGHRFYLEAARAARRREVRALFRRLADEEAQHLEVFRELAGRLPGRPEAGGSWSEEADFYLRALAEAVVFGGSGAAAGRAAADARQALEFGVRAEKDAIFYYSELLPFVAPDEKKLVERVISEERGHLTALFRLYQAA